MFPALLRPLTACALAGAVLVFPGVTGAQEVSGELLQLADMVAYLRERVRSENPEALGTPEALGRRFREELAQLDLDVPPEVSLSLELDDLKLAGMLLEEQLRRRRTAARRATLDSTDVQLSREVEALMADAQEHAPELAGEIAAIFQTIREQRENPVPAPPPPEGDLRNVALQVQRARAQGLSLPSVRIRPTAAPAPAPEAPAPEAPAPEAPVPEAPAATGAPALPASPRAPLDELDEIQRQLQAALREDPEAPASVAEDPLYGDRRFTVASPGAPEVAVLPAPPLPRSPRSILRELRARHQVAATMAAAPAAPAPAPVAPAPPPRERRAPVREPVLAPVLAPAVLAMAAAAPDPSSFPGIAPIPGPASEVTPLEAPEQPPAAGRGPRDRLVEVLERVVPMVRQQAPDPEIFPEALRSTLAALGIEAPGAFRPAPDEATAALAARLRDAARRRGRPLDLELAGAALAL